MLDVRYYGHDAMVTVAVDGLDAPVEVRVSGPLEGGCVRNEQTVPGRETTVAKRDDTIAAKRAAPQWTAFRPALRVCKQDFDEALGHPGVMHQEWQIDVDQRIGGSESFPRESRTAKTIDDPLILAQQIGVRLQELVLGDFYAPRSELHHVHDVEW